MVAVLELRVGESGGSLVVREGVGPRGVQLPEAEGGVAAFCSLKGDVSGVCGVLVGEVVGVVARFAGEGGEGDSGRRKGEAGDSGRLNGEVRGEPYERGEGL